VIEYIVMKRLHIIYTGSVQGVGFRYTARSIAQGLGLAGWVRNVPDGSVELVAEGEESILRQLLDSIRREMNYTHFTEQVSWEPGTGEFKRFEVSI
jgi:acylphosphatase